MPAAPLVSIVTPFLDSSLYLRDAIASVQAQSVCDWELILVDDGSCDGSREIAEAIAAADRRVRLLSHDGPPKSGPAAARNRGLAAARGDFVAFLDADDELRPEMLAITTRALQTCETAAMVFGPTVWWHPAQPHRDWTETVDGRENRLFPPPKLLKDVILLQMGHVPCVCSVLIRRLAIEAVAGFDERFRLYEDQTLWVKLFLRYPVLVVGEPLSRYRQHAESASAVAERDGLYRRKAGHPARAVFLDWVKNHVAQSRIQSGGLGRALALATAPYSDSGDVANRARRILLLALQGMYHSRQRLYHLTASRFGTTRRMVQR